MPQLIIGLGTGRCGTTSLARLLNAQANAWVSHELDNQPMPPIPRWAQDEAVVMIELERLLFQKKNILAGDVALFHLPYIERIAAKFPGVRFICMKRPKQATVKSFVKKTMLYERWRSDPEQDHLPWNQVFPKFNAATKEAACGMYWEYYYQECNRLQKLFPDSFFMFNMEDLSSPYGVKSILTACGIPESEQRILFFHENKLDSISLYKGAIKHYARIALGNRTYEMLKRMYHRIKYRKFFSYSIQPV
jgi:hypothetical protein